MTQPSEQLRAAAAKLRDTAVPISHLPTPWTVKPGANDNWRKTWRVVYPTSNPLAGLIATTPDYGLVWLADWIAMMSPAVAEPLAAWLEEASLEYERTLRDHGPDAATYAVYHAMPVALAILGEAP